MTESNLEVEIKKLLTNIPKTEVPEVVDKIVSKLVGLTEARKDYYVGIVVDCLKGVGVKLTRKALRDDIKQRENEVSEVGKKKGRDVDANECDRISPSLDFVKGVGYICIPKEKTFTMHIQGKPHIEIVQVPYLVTSNMEFFEIDELALYTNRKLILKSEPVFLSKSGSRWSHKYLHQFLKNGLQVTPASVFQEVKDIYDFYLEFREPYTADVLAIWTMGSYISPIFEAFPYLSLIGPKSSGKTKTLDVAKKLCFNGIKSPSITPAQLFRTVEGSSCTLLIDEAERLKDPKLDYDFKALINDGYKRGGEIVRSEPKTFKSMIFNIYSPKMFAAIRGLGPVLENRCLQFVMLRTKVASEKGRRRVSEKDRDWAYIRHLLYSFALTQFQKIEDIYLNDSEIKGIQSILNREGELWDPILAIAKSLDGSLYEKMKQVAITKSEAARLEGLDDKEIDLLRALDRITTCQEIDIFNSDIRREMMKSFAEGADPPEGRWIGEALKRLGLKEKSERVTGGWRYVIRRVTVKDVIERYSVPGE